MVTQSTSDNVLETLVVSHLAALRNDEAALCGKFSASKGADSRSLAAELLNLQRRAERLECMLDLMR
jgi:hypothetical protein